ncbi:MAG TPA: hypothetical protein VF840_02620 [Terriglobales bacterium]
MSAQRAQNINACVSDTLPDAMKTLKSKTKLRCAEIVIVMELLWNFSEKPEESCR